MAENPGTPSEVRGCSCSFCGRHFTLQKNLKRHLRKFHPTEISTVVPCAVCDASFENSAILQEHLDLEHPGITFHVENKSFHCEGDFENWKEEIEETSQSHFVKLRGDVLLADGRTAIYFACNRSGQYRCRVEGERKRRFKKMGTQKIGKKCPARISVYKKAVGKAMEIEVEYQGTHIGHRMEIGRLPLSKKEKTKLADQLSLGVPKSRILDNLRKSFSPTKRLFLTTKKDLHNVCRAYKIDDKVAFQKDDAITIDLGIKEMQKEDDNPVLLSNSTSDLEIDVTEKEIDKTVHVVITKELSKTSPIKTVSEEKAKILKMFQDMLAKCDTWEQLKDVEQTIFALNARITGSALPSVTTAEPSNKSIHPQPRSFSRLK